MTEQQQAQRARNLRLGLILASVAAAFFVGFVARFMLSKG